MAGLEPNPIFFEAGMPDILAQGESLDNTSLPLFVAVDRGCDMGCWYCTEYGENRAADGGRINDETLMDIVSSAYDAGVRTFRFTGGEPTLRKSLGALMVATQELGNDVKLALTTNGSELERALPDIAQLKKPSIFISVDSFEDITDETSARGHRIEKWLSPKIDQLVDSLPENANGRLNYVLTTTNREQLPAIVDYAVEHGLDVKVFELLLRDYFYVQGQTSPEAFLEQYQSVRSLIPELLERYGEPEDFAGTGGKGIPMMAFRAGENTRIITFDSSSGSHYGDVCNSCSHYPCQEGLYAMTLASNGTLHPSGCANESTYVDLLDLSQDERARQFKLMSSQVVAATFRSDVPDMLTAILEQPAGTPVSITKKKDV